MTKRKIIENYPADAKYGQLLWPGSFDNIKKLVEVIERDLNDRVDLFADAYADIYKHYDNAVKKLLDDKEELDKKIQDAFLERKEIIKGKLDLNILSEF